ncbi:MAG: universal stress protein [Lentisphaeraceae bacterium]|nr:universal stress protein [Lentisphaeraceae bacterium]
MSKTEHLLVAIDIGKNTEYFCQQAVEIAKNLDASVTLAHSIEYIPYYPYFPYDQEKVEKDHQEELRSKLQKLEGLFKKAGIELHESIVKKGKAYKKICEAADSVNATRIVIGVGPHYILENMIGSTAEKVVRQANQAVFLINPYKNLTGMNKILCGYDFTENSDRALLSAAKLAKRFSADLNIIHIIPETFLGVEALSAESEDYDKIKSEVSAELQKKVNSLDIDKKKVKLHILNGETVSKIIEFIDEEGIELLIIGTYSHGAFTRFFLGSTTEKIVRKAPCNIMTIKKTVVE